MWNVFKVACGCEKCPDAPSHLPSPSPPLTRAIISQRHAIRVRFLSANMRDQSFAILDCNESDNRSNALRCENNHSTVTLWLRRRRAGGVLIPSSACRVFLFPNRAGYLNVAAYLRARRNVLTILASHNLNQPSRASRMGKKACEW